MTLDGIIARARSRYATVMVDAATVTRNGTGGTFNTATLSYTPTAGSTVYSGACLVRPASSLGGPGSDEDGATVSYPYVVKFPADTDVQRGDAVTITASTYDSGMVGLTLWVADVTSDGWQTTQDAMCTDQVPEVLA